ncbi:trypsin-like peptidase domain-containing protein [Clostridia bacterium]|nr:trypsin-like peptidase domain-containing protein [Clostridia bacterium]
MNETEQNTTKPENKVASDNGMSFNEEYQEFLQYKENRALKKKRSAKGYFVTLIVILLIASFLFGMVFENQYGYAERLLTPAETQEDQFTLAQEQPGTPLSSTGSISPVVPIAESALPSIVAIESASEYTDIFGGNQEAQGTGSGIIISSDGYIVTNNHVVDGANSLTVILQDQTEWPATVIGTDDLSDLAVIKIEKNNLPAAVLGDSASLQVGELVVALGSPVGVNFAGSVTSGIISGLNREIYVGDKTMNLIQTDAAINPGNSGGALVNSNAQVIGINVLKFADQEVEGMSFSIPINEAKPIIEELINVGKVSRPHLGIWGRDILENEVATYNVPEGILIEEVQADSGAYNAGIVRGDIITHFENTRVTSMKQLIELIQAQEVGDTINITVERKDQTLTFAVLLGER